MAPAEHRPAPSPPIVALSSSHWKGCLTIGMVEGPGVRSVITLDVVAWMPTVFRQCGHCEIILGQAKLGAQTRQDNLEEYPSQLLEDHQRLSVWIKELFAIHGATIRIRLIDSQSPRGLWTVLRHGVRVYPSWVVAGRRRVEGWDRQALEEAIQAALQQSEGVGEGGSDV